MGRALVETNCYQVAELIRHWCHDTKFTPDVYLDRITECHVPPSDIVDFTAKSHFYRAFWRCNHSENAILLDFVLSPRLYCSLTLLVLSLFGILYCILLIDRIMSEYRGPDVITFIMCALLTMLCGWWQRDRIEPRLTRIEHSFWTKIQQSCDFRQVSYSVGRLYVPRLNLATELVLAICLILLCAKLMGVVGACISLLICVLVITRYVVGILQDRNQYSQWHLCLMDNVTSWTLLTLMLSVVFVVPCSMEVFLPQRLYLAETPASIRQAIANAQFRRIEPRVAHVLEDDCARYLHGLAEHDFSLPEHLSDADGQTFRVAWIQRRMVAYGYVFMVVLCVAAYFFSVRPFRALLKKQQTWALEFAKHSGRDGPSRPYLPQAWKWRSTLGLRCVIILHYVCGAIVNIAAGTLCVDSLGYAFLGHSILLANTANLCSWVYSSCKIALGPDAGQIAAAIAIITLSLLLLFLAGAFIRRVILGSV